MDELNSNEKEKLVKRYLSPLIFNLNPIYRSTVYVVTPMGKKEYIIVDRQDDFEMQINVTGLNAEQIILTVLNRLFASGGDEFEKVDSGA